MFASKIAKSQTNAAARSAKKLTHQRWTPVARPFGGGLVDQTLLLHRAIGNPVAPRVLAHNGSSLTGNEQATEPERMAAPETRRSPAFYFGKISTYPPDRANRPPALSQLVAPPLPSVVLPKLAIGPADDALENQADSVADQMMHMPHPSLTVAAASPQLSCKCATCEEGEKAQMLRSKPARTARAASETPPIVRETLRSPGQPLDTATRTFFEPRFGHDFSRVRIHLNNRAAVSARAVGALAYTVGNSIVFGNGQFRLDEQRGRRLVAHELAHVVQQGHLAANGNSNQLQRQIDDDNKIPENYPDWQHGAPTKPVSPDPHVEEIPSPPKAPPDQGPYRTPGTQPAPEVQPTKSSMWDTVLKVVIV